MAIRFTKGNIHYTGINTMRKTILGILLGSITLAPISALAGECTIPQSCKIISSEFSTGGKDSPSWVMEVDCEQPSGIVVKYLHHKFSASGMLGFGRMTVPKKIVFRKSKDRGFDGLSCKY